MIPGIENRNKIKKKANLESLAPSNRNAQIQGTGCPSLAGFPDIIPAHCLF
jgi:hypothetical protein